MNISTPPKEEEYPSRVIVKFHDEIDLPYEDGIEIYIKSQQIGPWDNLVKQYPGISFKRLYPNVEATRIRSLMRQAEATDPSYHAPNFCCYFVIDCSSDIAPDSLCKSLSGWRYIEAAYVDMPGGEPIVMPDDDPRSGNQGYLNPSPEGIDARFGWTCPGGDGTGLQLIDLERGWTLNHEDLTDQGAALLHGNIRDGSRAHGTSVLGEVSAVDNAIGCIGIAPNVDAVNVVSYWNSNRPAAIMAAIANLDYGDVLLLEAQLTSPALLPIEWLDAEFNAIRLATALGIVVIEAAGNGSVDLDTFATATGDTILNRNAPEFRDSGAIMVGAASSTVPHSRLGFSNYGSRIDCYAWGENVDTCQSNPGGATTLYRGDFNGTSSASPIVTGAALQLQGIAAANLGHRFNPQQVRTILSDPATGTPSAMPDSDRIGVMPNLKAIIKAHKLHKQTCEICIPIRLKVPIMLEVDVISKPPVCVKDNGHGVYESEKTYAQ
ncbi:MAG: S8 family peptidase [Cyanobacteria bacterium P01_F01_bin.116]